MIELRRVEEVGTGGDAGAVENHVERLAAAERDRVRRDVKIIACLVAQDLGVVPDQQHRDADGGEGLIFLDVEVRNAQRRPLSAYWLAADAARSAGAVERD